MSLAGARRFVALVYEKAADDNIFFLASGMTFGVVVAAIPFLLLLLTVAGLFLAPQFDAPRSEVLEWVWRLLPVAGAEMESELEGLLTEVADRAGSIGIVSGLAFVWLSTRLFGAVRTVVAEVFDLRDPPNVVKGKLLDVGMVVLSTVLLCLNIALTSFLRALGAEGLEAVGLAPGLFDWALGLLAAFLFVYLMFLFIYKFAALNRISWRTASLAAFVAAVGFELLKAGFGWWVTAFADYSSYFFAFATLAVLVLSIYYGSALFVLGGEVAQVAELRRTLEKQRELFEEA
ncbi:MAG: YihY/virulence factor BrkB family protein [Gemmatimonadota bacterium]